MRKIEHIGIAVKNIEESRALFRTLLGTSAYKEEFVESEGVKTVFFQLENIKIELLEATSDESPIAKFIAKKGEGLHHIAIEPDSSLKEQQSYLVSQGLQLINSSPKDGADNKSFFFIHPKSSGGVLVEYCKDK